MRLIDADALVKEIKRVYCTGCNDYCGIRCKACATDDALDMVEDAPTIDAEPVRHGRWIQSKTVPSYHHCSCCKRAHNMPISCNVYVLPYYCMDCGAKMDLEVQDD